MCLSVENRRPYRHLVQPQRHAAPPSLGGWEGVRTRDIARVAAVLWMACGLLVAATSRFLPFGHGARTGAMLVVGVTATSVGVVVWFLPWARWGRHATLALIPVACGVIAAFNA